MYVRVLRLSLFALLTLYYSACATTTPPEASLNPATATAVVIDNAAPAVVVMDTPTVEATTTGTPVPATATASPFLPTSTPTRTRTPLPTRAPTRTPTHTEQPATATTSSTVQAALVSAGAGDMNADEQKMFALINQERVKAGLSALGKDFTFQSVARARAMEMARTAFYSHYDQATGKLAAKLMLQRLSVEVPMGENYYVNWPYDVAFTERAMQWFMSDPPHHDNILSPRWTVGGVGVITTSDQKGISIQVFGMK